MNVKPLFKLMVEKKASDLFFAPFSPAKIKIDGKIMPVNKLEMTPKMVKQAAFELMDEDQDKVAISYQDNYPRLVQVKNKYDPANLLRLNANIKPTI